MQSFIEDPFLQRAFRDDKRLRVHCDQKSHASLFFVKHRMADFTPFKITVFIENKLKIKAENIYKT